MLCLSRPDETAHPRRLAAVAAATAIRAGVDFTIDVLTFGNDLCLPGLGLAIGVGAGPARVTAAGGEITVRGADRIQLPRSIHQAF